MNHEFFFCYFCFSVHKRKKNSKSNTTMIYIVINRLILVIILFLYNCFKDIFICLSIMEIYAMIHTKYFFFLLLLSLSLRFNTTTTILNDKRNCHDRYINTWLARIFFSSNKNKHTPVSTLSC
jgi:hypothetical protein